MSDSSPPPRETVRPGSGSGLSETDYVRLVDSTGDTPLDVLIAQILQEHEAEEKAT